MMLSFEFCICLLNISSYIKQSIFQSHCDGADLDERNSTQSTCDTQCLPVLPDECGQHSQSATALTGASVHQGSSTATQNNDKQSSCQEQLNMHNSGTQFKDNTIQDSLNT